MDLDRFRELPLLGILRGIREDEVGPVAETALAAGLSAIEITMNTDGAPALIRRLLAEARGRLMVGAGTVLTSEDLEEALDAGASFIVTPTLVEAVTKGCEERGIPVFPGALTPTEIHRAWSAGAAMVKVFPAAAFGPAYFKEIAGPFQEIELLACGGVTPENIGAFFKNGASAASFGGSIFKREWLETGAYDRVEAGLRELVGAYKASR